MAINKSVTTGAGNSLCAFRRWRVHLLRNVHTFIDEVPAVARQYSPLSVLRHLPADLVRWFCDTARVPLAVDWDDSPDVAALYAAWQALPPDP